MSTPPKKSQHPDPASRVEQANADFERLMQRSYLNAAPSAQSRLGNKHLFANLPELLGMMLGLLVILLGLALIGYLFWLVRPPIWRILLVLIGLALPSLCKCYGLIVGGGTALSGIRLVFMGGESSFSVLSVLPFAIVDPQLSYFYLGWGLLVASWKSRSGFGICLSLLNLLGGGLGLFKVTMTKQITLPGGWGALLSGLMTVGLGFTIVNTILQSWSIQSGAKSVGEKAR